MKSIYIANDLEFIALKIPDVLTKNKHNKSMRKVIHQENDIDIIVDDTICQARIMVTSLVGPAYIEKENTREVALAICPELETEKIQFAVGFLHWVRENDYVYSGGAGWYKDEFDIVIVNAINYITTEQLIQLYLTSTTNGG